MTRKAFTLIEILIVITVTTLLTTLTINSGVQSQRRAVFQSNFQQVLLLVQDARAQALGNETPANLGYGVEFYRDDEILQTVASFIDKDGNGVLDRETDEVINEVDLSKITALTMDFVTLTLEPNQENYNPEVHSKRDAFHIYYPSNDFSCELRATIGGEIIADLNFAEVVFGNEPELGFEELADLNINQFLSFHHLSCISEVSADSSL